MGQGNTAGQEPGTRSALWRLVAARTPQAPAPVVAAPRSADRVIASALARAADRVHGLPLFFDEVKVGDCLLAELPEILPDRAVLSVVQGPGDALGVMGLSPGLLAALIEMQALGRISARPAPERRPTRTDGAICADFVSACLAELAAEAPAGGELPSLAGWRYGSFVEDARPLGLLLEDVAYRRVEVQLRAGPAGQRDGRIVLMLPAQPGSAPDAGQVPGLAPPAALPAGNAAQPTAGAPLSPPPPGPMASALQDTPLVLQGVLCRRSISLGELRALTPGAIIALPRGALDMAVLETSSGQPLLRGRLGEIDGQHALRILRPSAVREEDGTGDLGAAGSMPMDDGSLADSFRPASADDAEAFAAFGTAAGTTEVTETEVVEFPPFDGALSMIG